MEPQDSLLLAIGYPCLGLSIYIQTSGRENLKALSYISIFAFGAVTVLVSLDMDIAAPNDWLEPAGFALFLGLAAVSIKNYGRIPGNNR